jgi:hypothetical protein
VPDLKTLKIEKDIEMYKTLRHGEKLKVFNTRDWNERIIDARTGEVEYFMGLQYSFDNRKLSFYDKDCGQFYVQFIDARLQNFYDYIRQQLFLKGQLEKAMNEKTNINLKLKRVDYSARTYANKYVTEMSYTKLDQKFLRQYLNVHRFSEEETELKIYRVVRRMSQEHLKRMLYNIFPNDESIFGEKSGEANTLLHFLSKFQLGFETIDFIASIVKKEGIVVPFLVNTVCETPLDLSVANVDHKTTNSLIRLIQRAPMDNHSRLISHLMPALIAQMDAPKLNKYFDRRTYQIGPCKTTKSLKLALPGTDYDMKAVTTALQADEDFPLALTNVKA